MFQLAIWTICYWRTLENFLVFPLFWFGFRFRSSAFILWISKSNRKRKWFEWIWWTYGSKVIFEGVLCTGPVQLDLLIRSVRQAKPKVSVVILPSFNLKQKLLFKVNTVQEACTKCFAVHIVKFEILQTTWKNKTKNIKILDLLMKTEN